MPNRPDISVVIPTYGREALLLDCVAGILAGELDNFEVLVIDQDQRRTVERALAERFPDERRVRYFLAELAGASRARNIGVREARAEIIAFIDDDAIADPGWLSSYAESFATIRPRPGLIGGKICPLWSHAKPDWYPPEREFMLGIYDIGDEVRLFPEKDQPIGANMAGWRDMILTLGGFDERIGPNYFRRHPMVTGEDALLGERVRRAGHPIYYQPRASVRHRISSAKLTRRYFLRRHFWEGVTVATQFHLLGERHPPAVHLVARVARDLAQWAIPRLRGRSAARHPSPNRMLALSDLVFSLGLGYGRAVLRERA